MLMVRRLGLSIIQQDVLLILSCLYVKQFRALTKLIVLDGTTSVSMIGVHLIDCSIALISNENKRMS